MKRNVAKLSVSVETIRLLTAPDLAKVAGGLPRPSRIVVCP
jgi:hypothetical protein